MDQISLCVMTRELCHQLYQGWENDPAIYMDMGLFSPYCYSKETVDRYFDAKQTPDRVLFAILKGGAPVGELQLKQIDREKRECTLSVHMQNDGVKGRGYGTQAERLTSWIWRRSTRTPWSKTPAASTFWKSSAFSMSGTRGIFAIIAAGGNRENAGATGSGVLFPN